MKSLFILVPNYDEKPENRLGGAFNNPLQPKMCFSRCSDTRLLKVKMKTALAVMEEPAATLVKLKSFNF